MSLPLLLALGQGHVERLRYNDPSVHLCHCLRGLLRGRETDEPKSPGETSIIHHHLARGEREGGKERGRERGREGGREGVREGGREGEREGEREGGREGERERGREGEREGEREQSQNVTQRDLTCITNFTTTHPHYASHIHTPQYTSTLPPHQPTPPHLAHTTPPLPWRW